MMNAGDCTCFSPAKGGLSSGIGSLFIYSVNKESVWVGKWQDIAAFTTTVYHQPFNCGFGMLG